MIGTPAGVTGVRSKASAIALAHTMNCNLFFKRGQTNPQKAAGTAASNPQTAGSPIALAPNAPRKVNRFQKIYTPIPVT